MARNKPSLPQSQQEIEPDTRAPGSSSFAWAVTLAMLAAVVAAVVYWPALSCEALGLDDYEYMVKNPLVRSPSFSGARRVVTEVLEPSTVHGYYQPLSMISLMLDSAMGGGPDRLTPYRATSLALHSLNVALVVLLLWRMFGNAWPAAACGLLFGVHPLTIESIPWLSERKTLLSMFFFLISVQCYLSFAASQGKKEDHQSNLPRFTSYAACLAAFVLSLASKPTSIALPLLLLLIDYWPLRRLSRAAVVEKIPLFAVAGVSAAITFVSQHRTADVVSPVSIGGAAPLYILCHNTALYFASVFWPGELSWFRAFPEPLSPASGRVLIGLIAAPLILLVLVASLRWTRAIFVGGAFFWIALLPVMNVVGFTITIAADRFVYLPMLGLLLPLCLALTRVMESNAFRSRRFITVGSILAWATVIGAESLSTRRHLEYWSSSEKLFGRMLAANPRSPTVHVHLGYSLAERGQLEDALSHFETAAALNPEYPTVHYQLARCMARLGRADEAILEYEREAQRNPKHFGTQADLAALLAQGGQVSKAIEHFEQAIALQPNNVRTRSNYAGLLTRIGKPEEAARQAREALRVDPGFVPALATLSRALYASGRTDEAQAYLKQAAQLDQQTLAGFMQFAGELEQAGARDRAVAVYQGILSVAPNHPGARARLQALTGRS